MTPNDTPRFGLWLFLALLAAHALFFILAYLKP